MDRKAEVSKERYKRYICRLKNQYTPPGECILRCHFSTWLPKAVGSFVMSRKTIALLSKAA